MRDLIRKECLLVVAYPVMVFFLLFGIDWKNQNTGMIILVSAFLMLFVVTLLCATKVASHAEQLAVWFGDPYGTLILTGTAISIEIFMIVTMMFNDANNPTLARDTMLSIIMIVMNGMIGVALLLGGLKHREQGYNLQGANAYLSIIMVLAVLGLVMPTFTVTMHGLSLSRHQSIVLAAVAVLLYIVFLFVQTARHSNYFRDADEGGTAPTRRKPPYPIILHASCMLLYLVPVFILAKKIALPLDYAIDQLGAPPALGGLVVGLLVATPEALEGIRAALKNHVQRSVNVFLGSILGSIGLTIPVILLVSLVFNKEVLLGLEHADLVMLILTLALGTVTLSSGKTNILQGCIHLALFAFYVLLIFEG